MDKNFIFQSLLSKMTLLDFPFLIFKIIIICIWLGTCHDVGVEDRGQLTRVRSLLHWVPEIKLRLSDLGEVPILVEPSGRPTKSTEYF